jgi:GR25 family glycosyltransferase involved in LPS biosynthesis
MRLDQIPAMCISLTRRSDRWKRFSDQPDLEALPNLERLVGVDGKLINIAADKRINPFTKRNILTNSRRSHEELDSPGGIGCALSHRLAWKKLLDSGEPYALIFEDDAIVPPGFIGRLNAALSSDPLLMRGDFDLLILSKVKSVSGPFDTTPKSQAPATGFYPIKHFVLAHAYLVSRRAAQIFYDECLPISHHIDFYMAIQCNLHKLLMVGSRQFEIPQVGTDSNIQTKATCALCDVPTNFYENYLMVPHTSWKLAKGSEYLILSALLGYVAYRAWAAK